MTDFTSLAWATPHGYIMSSDYINLNEHQTILYSIPIIRGAYEIFAARRKRQHEIRHNPLTYVLKIEEKIKRNF